VSPDDTGQLDGSDTPVTEQDAALLAAVRTMWESADPVPPGLVDRVRFTLDLEAVEVEMSRLVEVPELVGARSEEVPRLVTFESDSVTIMIAIKQRADGSARIDGWLTPEASHHIELRCSTGSMDTDTDDAGRFSLDAVPAGSVWLVVHDPECSHRVVTPTIEI
jgi:hypothetical protein